MATYYHVTECWDGGDLEPLAVRHPDRAEEMYLDRWPDAGELVQYHIHCVHLYASLEEARRHQAEYGGQLLEVRIPDDDLEWWVELDTLEPGLPHPVVRGAIPADMVSVYEEGR